MIEDPFFERDSLEVFFILKLTFSCVKNYSCIRALARAISIKVINSMHRLVQHPFLLIWTFMNDNVWLLLWCQLSLCHTDNSFWQILLNPIGHLLGISAFLIWDDERIIIKKQWWICLNPILFSDLSIGDCINLTESYICCIEHLGELFELRLKDEAIFALRRVKVDKGMVVLRGEIFESLVGELKDFTFGN